MWLCVIPSSCFSVGLTFVTCRKWSGMLGIGVCAPITLACCWLINGFISADNGGVLLVDQWIYFCW